MNVSLLKKFLIVCSQYFLNRRVADQFDVLQLAYIESQIAKRIHINTPVGNTVDSCKRNTVLKVLSIRVSSLRFLTESDVPSSLNY